MQETLSYQEVAQYYPEPNRRRPIVLIGPPNVGRHELRQRLMESDFDRFAAAVPRRLLRTDFLAWAFIEKSLKNQSLCF